MKKTPTQEESRHMGRVQRLGCVACRRKGWGATPAEVHHLITQDDGTTKGTSQRSSHFRTIPLCPPHHRGGVKDVIAVHSNLTAFEAENGTELELLEQTRRDLEREAARTIGAVL